MKNAKTAAGALRLQPQVASENSWIPRESRASQFPRPDRIDASVPAGVHSDSMSQSLAPFLGATGLPTGQVINVSMNAPSPHLTFKEWMARGVVGGLGNFAAWPFRFVGAILHDIARAIIAIIKWALLLILLPTMLIMGVKMANQMQNSKSIEEGSAQMVHNGRHALNGIGKGATDDLPKEDAAPTKNSR